MEVVTLRNASGHALHCMLERPSGPSDDKVACLLLSPGVKMRVAPHGLYRKLTKPFLDRGIAVLRVDFHGLGDSEGDLPEVQLDQLYRQVQLGRHVQDVRAAFDWLAREIGIERFIVGGLCGGALTGLLAAETEPRVIGLYSIGIPVILDGQVENAAELMTRGQLGTIKQAYLRRLLRPEAWWRLLTLQSDFRLIRRSLMPGRAKSKRSGAADTPAPDAVPSPKTELAANLNPAFPRAYFRILERNTPVLLLFSGADRLYFEYHEKFVEPWEHHLAHYEHLVRLSIIENANHILGDESWVAEARALTSEWLSERFG